MSLKKIDEPNYIKSCLGLLVITWSCVVVVLTVDILTIVIEANLLSGSLLLYGLKAYIVYPGLLTIVAMLIVHFLSILLLRKKMYMAQSLIYTVGVVFICFTFARSNQDLSISLLFFIVPIILSLVQLEKRMLYLTFGFSLIAYAVHAFLLVGNTGTNINETLLPINIEVSSLIFLIVFAICMIVINRHDSIHESIELEVAKNRTDNLTGYLNHSGFYDDLDDVFKNSERVSGEFSLAIIDIDNFTMINDEYGHGVGDEVIEIMTDSINKSLVNSAEAYRYSGEEFAIICKGQVEIVINMMDSILMNFKNKTEMKIGVAVTASAGICEYDPAQFSGKRDIFAAVDEALYVAKRLGKNQYAVWNEALVRDSLVSTGKIKMDDILDIMTGTE